MPSDEVAAYVEGPFATAQNNDPPQATEHQLAAIGIEYKDQLIPSGEILTLESPLSITQNNDPPQVI